MAQWEIKYRGAKSETLTAWIEVEEETTATELRDAIYDGKVANIFIEQGAIISITGSEPPSIA